MSFRILVLTSVGMALAPAVRTRAADRPELDSKPNFLIVIADDPQHAEVKARLSAELDRWMQQQNDPGVALDTRAALEACRRAASKGESRAVR